MAAGMHDAGIAGTVRCVGLLGDAQCIHVGPERNCSVAAAALQRADDAGAANALGDIIEAELTQLGGDEGGCTLLLEADSGCACRSRRQKIISCFSASRSSSDIFRPS
ncbi:hypothetical protein ASD12_26650 [Mesorhizobium sp. Root102]|nr:hypothetical protein ASD12_26650 [Mesorhizobium sp. Root102]